MLAPDAIALSSHRRHCRQPPVTVFLDAEAERGLYSIRAHLEGCPSWSKERDWKSRRRQKRLAGSNPAPSAIPLPPRPPRFCAASFRGTKHAETQGVRLGVELREL